MERSQLRKENINIKEMVDSVIIDLSNNTSINDYALKIQIIAKYLKNANFSQWVKNELEGYKARSILPPHRIIHTFVKANLLIDNGVKAVKLTDHMMPLGSLKKELVDEISTIELRDSVLSLLSLVSSEDKTLGYSITEYERYHLNRIYEYSNILSAHKVLQKTDCEQVIFKFKSMLLDLFIEFNETLFNNELDFEVMNKKTEIDKVINQTINAGVYITDKATANINNSNITSGNNNTIVISNQTKNDIQNIIEQIEQLSKELEADRDDIACEILRIRTELNNTIQTPKIIKSALNAIKGIAIGVGANQITPLVNDALTKIQQIL